MKKCCEISKEEFERTHPGLAGALSSNRVLYCMDCDGLRECDENAVCKWCGYRAVGYYVLTENEKIWVTVGEDE